MQFNCNVIFRNGFHFANHAISDIFEKRLGFRPRKPKNKEKIFLGSGN